MDLPRPLGQFLRLLQPLGSRGLQRAGIATLFLCGILADLCGCGSSVKTAAGPITIAVGSGSSTTTPKSLELNAKASVSMTPSQDANGAGVDWTVTCGGSPITGSVTGGACGTFSPTHTASGVSSLYTAPSNVPIGSNVTITASVTSDPSATSSLTLPIVAPSISISFAANSATSIPVGGQAVYSVVVANDSANAGVTWSASCGSTASGACGTFSQSGSASTVFNAPLTAPASPVVITATSVADSTVTASISVTIATPPAVAINVSPSAFTLGAAVSGETANLIATVSNDSSNMGVDWTAKCTSPLGNCGSLTPSHTSSGQAVTYLAPPVVPTGGTVSITATSTATETLSQPQTAVAVGTITSAKTISVSVSAPSSLTILGSTTLTATVTNDASSAGVTWSVTCGSPGACGGISNPGGSAGSYTAMYNAPAAVPAGGSVTISATPIAQSPAGNPGLAGIAITAIAPAVSILQAPPASMTANAQVTISAAVLNQTTLPSGITWTVQCTPQAALGTCGYVTPYQTASGVPATYTAPPSPPSGPVMLVASATSTCNSGTCSASSSSAVTITSPTALTVGFVPGPPTQLQQATSVNLAAAVTNDSTSAGVDWQVCASGCGFFTTTPEIPVPAQMPNAQPTPAVTATSVKGWPNGLPILYTAPASAPSGGAVTISAAADANNSISAVASVNIAANGTGPLLQGVVQAGSLPVVNAQVGLYAAGTSGYGSASTLVSPPGQNAFAVTDKNGNFIIAAGYSCPTANSQMYLVAIGGQPGSTQNPNLALMTALGPCAALSGSPVVISEVTTVASAWALAPFAANPLSTGSNSYLNIGASSGNTVGLANAFAAVNNLVSPATGQALFVTPAGNATVPYAEINSIADILNACAVTGGGQANDGSACGDLFVYANPYSNFIGETPYSGVPTDTLQASFEIAQNPDFNDPGPDNVVAAINGKALFPFATLASPFQPILASLPYDYSISLNFSGNGLSSTGGVSHLALDNSGDIWVSNTTADSVTELNYAGAEISPSAGYTTSSLVAPGPLAIDSVGNAWICGASGLTELNFVGTELPGSPFAGSGLTSTGCLATAFDGNGDLWATNSQSVSKFDQLGNPLTPAGGFTIATSLSVPTTVTLAAPLAIDKSNNVWVGVDTPVTSGFLGLAELNSASGLPNYLSPNPLTGSPSNFVDTQGTFSETHVAIDGSGNVWGAATPDNCSNGAMFEVPAYRGLGTTDNPSIVPGNPPSPDPFRCSVGVAVDGAGTIWTANAGGPALAGTPLPTPPNIAGFNPALSNDTLGYVSPSLASGPLDAAVDGSGNVWVLLEDNSVTEFIGVATPTVTPLSLAVKNKKLGSKP
jgi:hypothetical protein